VLDGGSGKKSIVKELRLISEGFTL
jgi:hypothetical protein